MQRPLDESRSRIRTCPARQTIEQPSAKRIARCRLAVWIADPDAGSFGRLSLIHVDPATGHIDRPTGAPQDITALPGFSIGDGRLAWATPPGQGGEGSRVQIVAWRAESVGSVETAPEQDVVVIH